MPRERNKKFRWDTSVGWDTCVLILLALVGLYWYICAFVLSPSLTLKFTAAAHGKSIESLAFDSQGTRLVSGDIRGRVIVWDVDSGKEQLRLQSPGPFFLSAISPGGNTVALAWIDDDLAERGLAGGRISLFDLASGRETSVLQAYEGGLTSLFFASDGSGLISGGYDGIVRRWDLASGKETARLVAGPSYPVVVAQSPDSKKLAVGCGPIWQEGKQAPGHRYTELIRILDASMQKEQFTLDYPGGARAAAFSPDGTMLATGNWRSETVTFWDTTNWREKLTIPSVGPAVGICFIEPDKVLIARFAEGSSLWGLSDGRKLGDFSERTGNISVVAYCQKAKLLAIGGHDGKVTVFDASGLTKSK